MDTVDLLAILVGLPIFKIFSEMQEIEGVVSSRLPLYILLAYFPTSIYIIQHYWNSGLKTTLIRNKPDIN